MDEHARLVRAIVELEEILFGAGVRTAQSADPASRLTAITDAVIELRNSSMTDHFLGVYRREGGMGALFSAAEHATSTNGALGFALMDIDHFKTINDSYGHGAGDAVLRAVATRVADAAPPDCVIARYGGDELMMILPARSHEHSLEIANKILLAIEALVIPYEGADLRVTLSIGVAGASAPHVWMDSLVNSADDALRRAKQNGRNRVEYLSVPQRLN